MSSYQCFEVIFYLDKWCFSKNVPDKLANQIGLQSFLAGGQSWHNCQFWSCTMTNWQNVTLPLKRKLSRYYLHQKLSFYLSWRYTIIIIDFSSWNGSSGWTGSTRKVAYRPDCNLSRQDVKISHSSILLCSNNWI